MKNLVNVYSILILFASLLSSTNALAQRDPKAKSILDAVKDKYESIKAFKAEFTYTINSPSSGVNDKVSGEITVKGSKFFLKLPDQEIITNGSTQWTYLKDGNEVNVSDYEPDEDEITPNKIYSIYEKDYDYVYVKDTTENNRTYDLIELKPKDRNAQFFKIRLKIVQDTRSIKSWEIFERNSNRYVYSVNHFATVKVGDSYFKFDPRRYPENPDVIDLR